ncbi:unnamed protein product, partial [Cladocopium goreaui]
ASKLSLGNSVVVPWLRRTLRSSHSCTLPGAQWFRRSPGPSSTRLQIGDAV